MAEEPGSIPYPDGADALRLATDRFEAAIQASQVVVFTQDLELRYTWIHNPAFGYSAPDVIGRTDAELFERPSDAARLERIKRAVLDSGEGRREEVLIWHEGTQRCYDLSVRPQFDAAGVLAGVTCAAVDITGQRQAQSDLLFLAGLTDAFGLASTSDDVARIATERVLEYFRLSRCLLLEIDQSSTEATLLCEHGPGARSALPATVRLDDFYTPEEILSLRAGRSVLIGDVARGPRSPESIRRFHDLSIEAIASAPYLSEGRVRFVLSAVHPHTHEWRPAKRHLLQEVAARTCVRLGRARAEQALRASHATFHHLVVNSPFGVYVVDADFRLSHVSAGAQKVFRSAYPFIGRDIADVLRVLWPEPFATEAIRAFRHTLDTGEPYHSPSSVERRRDSGVVEAYDWKLERITLPDGRHGVVCHFYDLSERQQHEAALRNADRQKDEFIATLAHELRNPLAPVRTAAAVLRRRGGGEPWIAACADVIERQSLQMSRLLDDLLDVSRLSRGTLVLKRAVMSLEDSVRAAVEMCRPLVDARRQVLQLDLAPDLRLDGDAARLTQVFANLVHNAVKFSPDGARIELSSCGSDGHAVVRVRDAGIGIAPDMVDRIFDLFVQAGSDGDGNGGGLGIGLSLAKRLIDMHGGSIHAASAGIGLGSEFTVVLPLASRASHANSDRSEPADVPATRLSRRVLVVDDNVDAAEMLALALGNLGCEVETAYRGEMGLRAAALLRPDVVLLDLGLPDMDGLEVARRLRQAYPDHRLKLIAVSGWGRAEDRLRTTEAGFDLHLTKPTSLDDLLAVIRAEPDADSRHEPGPPATSLHRDRDA